MMPPSGTAPAQGLPYPPKSGEMMAVQPRGERKWPLTQGPSLSADECLQKRRTQYSRSGRQAGGINVAVHSYRDGLAGSPVPALSHSPRLMSDSVRPMQPDRKMKYSVIFSVESLPPLLRALCQMFIVGCQFDERFSYENVEALARQSLAFLRLSVQLFGSRSARFQGRLFSLLRRVYV